MAFMVQLAESHPSWVCGLKLEGHYEDMKVYYVTPFVGVWIETRRVKVEAMNIASHTLRGCVD